MCLGVKILLVPARKKHGFWTGRWKPTEGPRLEGEGPCRKCFINWHRRIAAEETMASETAVQNHADSDEEDHALYKDYYYMNAAFDEQVDSPHDVKCMRALFDVLVSEETTTLLKMEEKHPDLVFRWAVPALNRHPLFKVNEPHESNTEDIKVELNGFYMQSLHRAYKLGFERGSRPPKKQRTEPANRTLSTFS